MSQATFVVACVSLVTITVGVLVTRANLKVIHAAVNSNMTRALDEITQLHKDVTLLIQERDKARIATATMQGGEQLAGRLETKVDGITEQQRAVAANLVTAQTAVDGVAADLAESHRRADDVPHDDPPGSAADAASKQGVPTEAEGTT